MPLFIGKYVITLIFLKGRVCPGLSERVLILDDLLSRSRGSFEMNRERKGRGQKLSSAAPATRRRRQETIFPVQSAQALGPVETLILDFLGRRAMKSLFLLLKDTEPMQIYGGCS